MSDRVLSVDAFRRQLEDSVRAICKEHGSKYDSERDRGLAYQI